MPEGGDHGYFANWWNGGALGDPAWERYHLDQVIPYVEQRLPIRRGRRWHSIAGVSMGGFGAAFYASQRPGYFGSAVSFSGVLSLQRPYYGHLYVLAPEMFGDPVEQEFYWRGHNPKELVENLVHTRLYVSVGDGMAGPNDDPSDPGAGLLERELALHAAEFNQAAEQVGVPIAYRPRQGVHGWNYWRPDLQDTVDWGLFERPPAGDDRWAYRTVAGRGRMWGLRFRFSDQPQEVIRFERSGSTLDADGSGEVTLRSGPDCSLTATLPFSLQLPQAC